MLQSELHGTVSAVLPLLKNMMGARRWRLVIDLEGINGRSTRREKVHHALQGFSPLHEDIEIKQPDDDLPIGLNKLYATGR